MSTAQETLAELEAQARAGIYVSPLDYVGARDDVTAEQALADLAAEGEVKREASARADRAQGMREVAIRETYDSLHDPADLLGLVFNDAVMRLVELYDRAGEYRERLLAAERRLTLAGVPGKMNTGGHNGPDDVAVDPDNHALYGHGDTGTPIRIYTAGEPHVVSTPQQWVRAAVLTAMYQRDGMTPGPVTFTPLFEGDSRSAQRPPLPGDHHAE